MRGRARKRQKEGERSSIELLIFQILTMAETGVQKQEIRPGLPQECPPLLSPWVSIVRELQSGTKIWLSSTRCRCIFTRQNKKPPCFPSAFIFTPDLHFWSFSTASWSPERSYPSVSSGTCSSAQQFKWHQSSVLDLSLRLHLFSISNVGTTSQGSLKLEIWATFPIPLTLLSFPSRQTSDAIDFTLSLPLAPFGIPAVAEAWCHCPLFLPLGKVSVWLCLCFPPFYKGGFPYTPLLLKSAKSYIIRHFLKRKY